MLDPRPTFRPTFPAGRTRRTPADPAPRARRFAPPRRRAPGARRLLAGLTAAGTLAAVLLGLTAHTVASAQTARKHDYRTVWLLPTGDGFVSTRWQHRHFGKLLHVTVGERHGNARTTFLRF